MTAGTRERGHHIGEPACRPVSVGGDQDDPPGGTTDSRVEVEVGAGRGMTRGEQSIEVAA